MGKQKEKGQNSERRKKKGERKTEKVWGEEKEPKRGERE